MFKSDLGKAWEQNPAPSKPKNVQNFKMNEYPTETYLWQNFGGQKNFGKISFVP